MRNKTKLNNKSKKNSNPYNTLNEAISHNVIDKIETNVSKKDHNVYFFIITLFSLFKDSLTRDSI